MGMDGLRDGSFMIESTTPPSGPEVRSYCWGRMVAAVPLTCCWSRRFLPGGSQAYELGRSVVFAGFEAKAKSPGDFPQGLVILQGEFIHR